MLNLDSGNPANRTPRVAIIGAGFAGIAAAVKLSTAGIGSFTVFEKSDGVGGVWRDNTYPGAEVDTPSHWYSFSFRYFDWPRTHGRQADLSRYLNQVTDEFGVRPHIRFNTAVRSLTWVEDRHGYDVELEDGSVEEFDVVISAVGLFNVPRYPDWPGLDSFEGPLFHTARWEHQHDLSNAHVAIVGTGSTGAQLATALAPTVKHLTIFQRDPGWITPKGERDLSDSEREKLRDPRHYRRERRRSFLMEQARFWGGKQMQAGTKQNAAGQAVGENYIATTFKDREDLRAVVTPNHPFFGKRPVRATGFYETLLRDNVTFLPRAVDRVTPRGLVDVEGQEHEFDAIVLATGFRAAEYLGEIELRGRKGRTIHERWNGTPDAFVGITVPEFPNFYMLYGPNTNMGTIVFNLETQADYAVRDIKRMRRTGVTAIETREVFHKAYNRWLQNALRKTVWTTTPSYYKTPSGKLVVPFPTAMVVYWALTRLGRRVGSFERRIRRPHLRAVASPADPAQGAPQDEAGRQSA
ncbi:flavin-containing monooxygenase [Pseudonocardia halophobica]|uniref:flavin-containing monooxygenase n=1 Tax=Pseudonocardia halophobica TaxID=29401 RepID=UPI003D8E2A75